MAFLSSEISELLTNEVVDKLNKLNIWTVNDLIGADQDTIRRASLLFKDYVKISADVRQKYVIRGTSLSSLFKSIVDSSILCPTGIPELTRLLDGGYQTGELVEVFGDTESGKTELCYLLCAEILTHYQDVTILYIAANHDINTRRIVSYIRDKLGQPENIDDTQILNMLSRVEVARPVCLTELVHLLNTAIHFDKRNKVRCVILDSLSFIVQDDILTIRSSDTTDAAAALSADEALASVWGSGSAGPGGCTNHRSSAPAVANLLSSVSGLISTSIEGIRRETIDVYLHEVMRLLTNFANTKNSIIFITSGDTPLLNNNLTYSRAWSNAIDTRIRLEKMSDYSDLVQKHPNETIRRAVITKHQHGIQNIGRSVTFVINEVGIKTIQATNENL